MVLIAALPRPSTATRRYPASVLLTLEVITALRGAGFGIQDIRRFLKLKQPGQVPAARMQRLQAALAGLLVQVHARRADLERAEALLKRWQAEVTAYQQQS